MSRAEPKIVVVHGLASKPPKITLARRYRKYLGRAVGRRIKASECETVYWADLMGYDPPDTPAKDEYKEGANNFRAYSVWEEIKFQVRGTARPLIVNKLEEQLSDYLAAAKAAERNKLAKTALKTASELIVSRAASRVYGRFLPDLHGYFFGGKRGVVQKRLTDCLNSLPKDSKVCLIAHSMGSIIALDVILNDPNCRPINTFVTIGSPLGITVVKEQLGVNKVTRKALPRRIKRWFNFYDRLDIVALDSDLADEFPEVPLVDMRIRNEFVNKNGERNHHKSYGYLRTKPMGEVARVFLK